MFHIVTLLFIYQLDPNCLVDESACAPHRYHGISDTFLHSLSIMYLFDCNLLLYIYCNCFIGFDDQGSQYNGAGELKNWWSPLVYNSHVT